MQQKLGSTVAVTAMAIVLAGISEPASALVHNAQVVTNAGQACQLSKPTIDTLVSPRANGFRNDGSSNVFVLCGYANPMGFDPMLITLFLTSADGKSHDLDCTATKGIAGYEALAYLTKPVSIPATGYGYLQFNPADFGGTSTIPNALNFSVTCNLPPHAAITVVQAAYAYEIGQ
jgi:hypothetical protein